MKEITLILAGNYIQYTDWMYYNKLGKENLDNYRYASHPDKVMELIVKDVIVIGTFWDDFPHAGDMYNLAQSRIRRTTLPITDEA